MAGANRNSTTSSATGMFDRMKKRSFSRSGVIPQVDVESGNKSSYHSPHAKIHKKRFLAANDEDRSLKAERKKGAEPPGPEEVKLAMNAFSKNIKSLL